MSTTHSHSVAVVIYLLALCPLECAPRQLSNSISALSLRPTSASESARSGRRLYAMHHVPSEEMDWVSTVAVGLALDELRAEPRKHESMEMEIYSNDAAGEDAVIAVVGMSCLLSLSGRC